MSSARLVIGVLSDTHGPLSPEAAAALAGVDHILHAGDMVAPAVLPALEEIAGVTAVRGNMDYTGATHALPARQTVSLGGASILVLHNLLELDQNPPPIGTACVVHGHTHRADITWRDGVLYLNPGSAGRGGSPTVARLTIAAGEISAEIVKL